MAACLGAALATARAQHAQTAGFPGLSARASVAFEVRVPPLLRLRVRPASDPTAGEGLLLEVATNLRQYALRFELRDPDVAAVEVFGLGAPLRVGRGGALHRMVGVPPGRRSWVLGYRVHWVQGRGRPQGPVPLLISAEST